MRVVFNGKDVGYACVQYFEYIDGQKSPTTFDTNFDGKDQDKNIWYGVSKIVFNLDRHFLNVEGYGLTDNIICTRIFPTRRILECYNSTVEPLLPVSVDNVSIVNRGQVDAYCNGFADGQKALAEHPGVRSHVSSSMVLPQNASGLSDTVKIMPNGSAAEIGRPHIINQTNTGIAGLTTNCDRPGYTPCWDLGHFAGNQTTLQMGCPGLLNGNKSQADNYCLGFKQGQIDLANQQQQNHVIK